MALVGKQLTFEAAFSEDRTIENLAQEQQHFLETVSENLIDVDLPSDNKIVG